jgi:hypothetical protein
MEKSIIIRRYLLLFNIYVCFLIGVNSKCSPFSTVPQILYSEY